jgi:hypothetical protein
LVIPWPAETVPRWVSRAGLLGELEAGQFLGRARLVVRETALRERPAAPPERVAVLLDQVESAVLGRDDEREVALLNVGVGAAGAVAALDLVPAEREPLVGVDDAGRQHPDFGVWGRVISRLVGVHPIILPGHPTTLIVDRHIHPDVHNGPSSWSAPSGRRMNAKFPRY